MSDKLVKLDSLKPLLQKKDVILGLDAYGVIYNKQGVLPYVKDVIDYCIKYSIPYVMMTNNALKSVQEICNTVNSFGIKFDLNHIISSGCGCYELDDVRALIMNKRVFVYGYESSQYYAKKAGGIIVEKPNNADVIVMAASLNHLNHRMYRQVYSVLKQRDLPVICINPDHYIAYNKHTYPVMGYYASLLEKQLDRKWIWLGKPYPIFSELIKKIFNRVGLNCENLLFCDDNPYNVLQIVNDLKCKGCIVTKTGIYHKYSHFLSDSKDIYKIPFCKL